MSILRCGGTSLVARVHVPTEWIEMHGRKISWVIRFVSQSLHQIAGKQNTKLGFIVQELNPKLQIPNPSTLHPPPLIKLPKTPES